jgi:predicted metalloprotease
MQFVRFATTTGEQGEFPMADDRDDVEREHTTVVETGGGGGGGGVLAVVLLIIVVLVLLYLFRGYLGLGHSTTIPSTVNVNVNSG